MPDGPGNRPGNPKVIDIFIIYLILKKKKNDKILQKINKPCKLLIIETPDEIDVGKECLDCCSIEIDVLCKS